MNKPWITSSMRSDIWKQINLGKLAKKTKKNEDVSAFTEQKSRVSLMMEEAQVNWLSEHPEQEEEWLKILAQEEMDKSYFCDVCEKGFGDKNELLEHEQQHQTCGIDGCTYTAHTEVLDKHIMHQHPTGLYNKIAQGNSPEEIQKSLYR